MYKHSIIDSYPMMLDKSRGEQEDQSECTDFDDPTADTNGSDDNDDNASLTCRPDEEPASVELSAQTIISEKIARDVLIFKKIAERLPPQSLLHLLSADVLVSVDNKKSDTGEQAVTIEAQEQHEKETREDKNNLRASATFAAPFRSSKVKFAIDDEGKIFCQTKYVEGVSDKSLWWQRHEMDAIRAECTQLVESYITEVREYERSLTNIMEQANEHNFQDHDEEAMQCFRDHGDVRGLERHIVLELNSAKQIHFDAVIGAQYEYLNKGTTERWKHLKKVSLAASLSCRYIAVRFAQSDEEELRRIDFLPPVPSRKERTSGPMKAAFAPAKALRKLVRRGSSGRLMNGNE